MSTKPQNNHAARPGDMLDTFLAISRIYFASSERLSELALEAARSSVEDCVAAARLGIAQDGHFNLQGWQSAFAQPAIERARSYTRSTYEILVGAQADAARVLGQRLAMPPMQFPLSDDWMSAFDRFSRGIRELAATGAANTAAAANIPSEEAAKADVLARKAA